MQEYITSKIGTKQRTPTTTEYFSTTSYFKNEDQKTEKNMNSNYLLLTAIYALLE